MFWRFLMGLPVFIGEFFRCIFVGCVIGPMAFFLGQLLPRKNFNYEEYPYKSFPFEKNGRIYQKIGIHYWKDTVPDMSRYLTSMVQKRINVFRSAQYIDDLIRETCVAELVHCMLILLSPIFVLAIEGTAGFLGMCAYIIANIPFILIQRYNRPRLIELHERQKKLAIV